MAVEVSLSEYKVSTKYVQTGYKTHFAQFEHEQGPHYGSPGIYQRPKH